jgi:hypothetical protein
MTRLFSTRRLLFEDRQVFGDRKVSGKKEVFAYALLSWIEGYEERMSTYLGIQSHYIYFELESVNFQSGL